MPGITDDSRIGAHLAQGLHRMVRWGLSVNVANKILNDTPSPDAFPKVCAEEGRRWEELGNAAVKAGNRVTSRGYFKQGFFAYRLADFFYTVNSAEKLEAYDGTLRCFELATAGEVVPVAIATELGTLRGYIAGSKLPSRSAGALFVYGSDGNKEEHFFGSVAGLVARGIRVLVVDGPGQGYAIRHDEIPARYNYEIVGTPAFDVFVNEADVDPKRIGMVGSSLGGYYGPRAFAYDKRYRALVCNSGVYDVLNVFDHYPLNNPQLIYNVRASSKEEAREIYRDFTLDAIREEVSSDERPVRIVQGSLDTHVPTEHAERLAALFGGRVDLEIVQGATHNLANVSDEVVPALWDWLASHLASEA